MKKFSQISLSFLILFSTFFGFTSHVSAEERTPYDPDRSFISFVSNDKLVTGRLKEGNYKWVNLSTSEGRVMTNAQFYDVKVNGKTRLYQTYANKKGFLVTRFTEDGTNWTTPVVDRTKKVTSNFQILRGCGYVMSYRDPSNNQIFLRYSRNGRKWGAWEMSGESIVNVTLGEERFRNEGDTKDSTNCIMYIVGDSGNLYYRVKPSGATEWTEWTKETNEFVPRTDLQLFYMVDTNELQAENNGMYITTTDSEGNIYFRKSKHKVGSDLVGGSYEWLPWIQSGTTNVGEEVIVSKQNVDTFQCYTKGGSNKVFYLDCSYFGLNNTEWLVFYDIPVKKVAIHKKPAAYTEILGFIENDNTVKYEVCNNYCLHQNNIYTLNNFSNITSLNFHISDVGLD